ncbi:LPS assembly protein LptD [Pseudomonas stutzeri]|nr:LPS assembly protein LptD [Stutzerimonas stutzeri]
MALTPPLFRRKFPLLVTGSLLALGSVPLLHAAEQFDCQASPSGGWACTPKSASGALPARPQAAPGGSATSAPPASSPSVARSGGRALAERSADYSHLDWVPREKLSQAQLAEIAPYCAGTYVEPPRVGMDDDTPPSEAPTFVSARATRYEQQSETTTLAGNVVLRQGSMQAEADEASLRQQENKGELVGNVRLRDRGLLVVGDRAELQLDNGEAVVDNAEYVVHAAKARGSAEYVKRREDAVVRLKDGTYTRCEPGENTWHLKGNNITLNPATGFGSATNVTLRVKDVPVFYTPYIYFPIDDRRQSGFLPPSLSTSSDNGFSLQTPYYFNLAPNYDATLYPTWLAERGLLMEGELRYLTAGSEGQLGGAWLDDRDDTRKRQSEYDDRRWMYSWQHRGGLDSRLLAEVDYTDISDPYYFQDLDTALDIAKPDFLDQRASLTWRGDSYSARLAAHAYEPTSVVDVTPYDRLPQFSLDGALPFQPGGLRLAYGGEFVRFERDLRSGNFINENGGAESWYDNNVRGLDRANGDRLHLEPGVSLPLEWAWGFARPSVKYLHTQYDLSLDGLGRTQMATDGRRFDDAPDRRVAVASLDSGLYFDRDSRAFGGSRQTLEPRAFYLYVPEERQDAIPVFDSAESAFSFDSLWRENRFSGKDRIGDANQLSLGVTSRWFQADGLERQRLSLGQAFYFEDRKVQLPGIDYRNRSDATASQSPYALQYLYRFNRDWRLSSDFNWDPDSHRTRSGSAMLHYQPEASPNKVINLGYRYRNDFVRYDQASGTWTDSRDFGTPGMPGYIKDYYKIQQHDLSTIWPIAPQWSVIARWQHDYNRNRTLEAFGGFEYDSCCWKLRLINRYWIDYDETSLNPARNDDADRGVFLQIVLKGLGGVTGNKVESFLDQGIQGYREREEQAYQ